MNTIETYKLSFTTGGLFLNESVEVARIYSECRSWEITRGTALDGHIAMLPKTASQRRTIREIINRLSMLRDSEAAFLATTADRAEQAAMLWLATCRAYRIVREFAVDVVRERWLSHRYDLKPESFDIYFQSKAEWNQQLEKTRSSTRQKLRQVLFRIMRDVGLLNSDNTLQLLPLSDPVRALILEADPADLLVFPGAVRENAS